MKMTSRRLGRAAIVAFMWVIISFGIVMANDRSSNIDEREIGRIALTHIGTAIRVKELIDSGNPSAANKLLDSQIGSDLLYVELFDSALNVDDRYIPLRNKVIAKLKSAWLRNPPGFLYSEANAFIEHTCRTNAECLDGTIAPATDEITKQ